MILTKVGGRLMPRILTKVGGRLMNNGSVLSVGVVAGFLLVVVSLAFPPPARAAWVNGSGTQFQVGGKLTEIVPTLVSTAPGIANSPALVAPACGSQGGTSLALVRGSKLAGVDPVLYPIVLVVSCLDNGKRHHPEPVELHQPDCVHRGRDQRRRRYGSQADHDHDRRGRGRAEQRLGAPRPPAGQGRSSRLWVGRHSLQHRLQPDQQRDRRHGDAALRPPRSPAAEGWPGTPKRTRSTRVLASTGTRSAVWRASRKAPTTLTRASHSLHAPRMAWRSRVVSCSCRAPDS